MNYSTLNDSDTQQARQPKDHRDLDSRRRSALQKDADRLFTQRRTVAGEALWPATVLLAWGALQVWQAFNHWFN